LGVLEGRGGNPRETFALARRQQEYFESLERKRIETGFHMGQDMAGTARKMVLHDNFSGFSGLAIQGSDIGFRNNLNVAYFGYS
jgi:hypothetical protein